MNNTQEVIIKNQVHNHAPDPSTEIETLEIISFEAVMKLINDWEK